MGATNEVSPGMRSSIRFKMDFALKLMNNERSLTERKTIEDQRRVYGTNKDILPKRIDLHEFNKIPELLKTRTRPKLNRMIGGYSPPKRNALQGGQCVY